VYFEGSELHDLPVYYIPIGQLEYTTTELGSKLHLEHDESSGKPEQWVCEEVITHPGQWYSGFPLYVNDPFETGVPFVTEADALPLPMSIYKVPY
jgi:hypothetical protein